MVKLLSIADCVSLTNAFFGFLSLIMVFIGEIRLAFSFILLAILADGLDGIIARKTRESKIGEYLESMADMTSLGIAPAFFIFTAYYKSVSCCINKNIVLLFVLALFLLLSIIRLASFHIMKEKKFFIGLPASSSTIIIIISFLMISQIHFPKPDNKINAIAGILIFLTLIMDKYYNGIAPLLLITAICIYVIFGPFYLLINKKK